MSMPVVRTMTLPIVEDGQVWWDGVRLPVVKVESFWTRPDRVDMNRWGFIATLASENGADVSLCFDPDGADRFPEDQVSISVAVPHRGQLLAGKVRNGVIRFDLECEGGHCAGCEHYYGAWFEWVHSPAEVLSHLHHLGQLPVKAEVAS